MKLIFIILLRNNDKGEVLKFISSLREVVLKVLIALASNLDLVTYGFKTIKRIQYLGNTLL